MDNNDCADGDVATTCLCCCCGGICNSCGLSLLPFCERDPDELFIQLTTQIPTGTILHNPLSSANDTFIGLAEDIDPDINLIKLMSDNSSNYFTDDIFNEMVSTNQLQSKIKILHLNVRSYSKNQSDLWTFLKGIEHKFHIIALTETWTNPDNEDQLAHPGYNAFIRSRTTGRGGGVALLVDDSFQAKIIDINTSTNSSFESIFVQVSTTQDHSLLIGSIYRPPNTDPVKFNIDLDNLLVDISTINKSCYLCGDFNMNLLNIDSHQCTNEFVNIMSAYLFRPLIEVPTRITNTSSSLIDNIFTNSLSYKECSGLFTVDISDHLPIFTVLDWYSHPNSKAKFVSYRPKNERALANLQAALDKESWNDILCHNNPDLILNSFNAKLYELYDLYFPLITKKARIYKTKIKPWISPSLLKSCKTKNKLYKKYLKSKANKDLIIYKNYKNKLTGILRNCEKQYYSNLLEQHKSNLKETWKIIKELLQQGGTHQTTIPLIINGVLIQDPITIANEFNGYFASIGPNMAADIPPTKFNHSTYLKKKQP